MRTSMSFSLDTDRDAILTKWLASQANVSKVIREALYHQMETVDRQPSATELLAAVHRIEGELSELKALVSVGRSAGAATPQAEVDVEAPILPPGVLANLRKLRGKP